MHDLRETAVPMAAGTPTVAWANSYQQLNLIPTHWGAMPAMSLPDGRPLDGAGVVAFDGGRVLLVRQHRFAAGVQTWEIPLGGVNGGESPADAAARELFEETGASVRSSSLAPLGFVRPNSSRLTGGNWLFFASVSETELSAGVDEVTEATWVDVESVVQACLTGEVTDASTVSAVLRARLSRLL